MFKKFITLMVLIIWILMAGCASVPMASAEQDMLHKKFDPPKEGLAGLYVYRNTFAGQALKKSLYLDNQLIGESANKVYFFKEINPGKHTLSTESEFSDNSLDFNAVAGKNYFFEQYIRLGVFVGGANIKEVSEEKGKKNINECKLAK